MTAPLPPMPEPEHEIRHETDGYVTAMHSLYSERTLQAYAKLTAREALERAIAPCNSIVEFFHGSENMHALHIRERDTAKEIADAIRGIIKEYE